MRKVDVNVSLLEQLRQGLFAAAAVFFAEKGISDSKTPDNQDRIGKLLKEKDNCVPITILRNWRDKIRQSRESVAIKIDVLVAVERFFEEVIQSKELSNSSDLGLRGMLKELISEITILRGKTSLAKGKAGKYDILPDYLTGVYRGYFLRPLKERPKDHIAMLVVYIDSSEHVFVKSTKVTEYKRGDVIYQEKSKILVCKFEGTIKGLTHIFQFSLKHELKDTFENQPVLKGIYGGTDPKEPTPICGKIILDRVDSDSSLGQTYEATTPLDFETEKSIIELFNEKPYIFDFLKSKDYIEDTSFFKHFSLGKKADLGRLNLAGVYSIYSLHSSEFQIGVGLMKIERIGKVTIKGSDDKIYFGYAKIFDQGILAININKVSAGGGALSDFYFNYLVKVSWEDRSQQDFYHGIRTIIVPSDGTKHKPSAARVVIERNKKFYSEVNKSIDEKIKKEGRKTSSELIVTKLEREVFDKMHYELLDILPFQWDRETGKKLVFDSKIVPYNYQNDDFKKRIVDYLLGECNNLIIGSVKKTKNFIKNEKYADVYFNAAINYANKGLRKSAKLNFERAFLHGFFGDFYGKMLLKEKERLSPKGKEIIDLIKEVNIDGTSYFYFED